MTPRTITAPPTDRRYWRRLLRLTHPDQGGDPDLFVWVRNLQEHVAGELPAKLPANPAKPTEQRRKAPPKDSATKASERVPFEDAFEKAESFADLTAQAVQLADTVEEPYAHVLRLLEDCTEAPEDDVAGYRAQHQGASYKQLAYIAHLAGLDRGQRTRWYKVAESIPLAQRHAGHLIARLKEKDE